MRLSQQQRVSDNRTGGTPDLFSMAFYFYIHTYIHVIIHTVWDR